MVLLKKFYITNSDKEREEVCAIWKADQTYIVQYRVALDSPVPLGKAVHRFHVDAVEAAEVYARAREDEVYQLESRRSLG